ncbi:hypothetical protein CWE13_07595 [Aliidiomarina shirensis]|uniref:Thiol:disulfide interchange protein n=1 Tax=Aliidiomarina shirensis TaxID=1048642 RepID=A0A432WSH1_9GAMM|nr:DsbC family protein [Aliidiomarina shirensis]RUO36709.1 hypothetical protein CWE13_07595 [Aliidiomarina shirensis]
MKIIIAFILGALLATGITFSVMQSNSSTNAITTERAADNETLISAIREQSPQFRNAPIRVYRELSEFGFSGFYEISIGGQGMVVNSAGNHAVVGDLFQLEGVTNLSANYRNTLLAESARTEIANISSDLTIEFPANADVPELGTLYVFTDPTCPYCQRLHNEKEAYAAAGINIHYIPYPRTGLDGGRDYQQLVQIMCADDQAQAMSDFKDGNANNRYTIPGDDTECRALVQQGFEMGQRIGISGTPFIIKSTGGVLPGYSPAQTIINQMRSNR